MDRTIDGSIDQLIKDGCVGEPMKFEPTRYHHWGVYAFPVIRLYVKVLSLAK